MTRKLPDPALTPASMPTASTAPEGGLETATEALRLFQAGRLEEAEQWARDRVARQPDDASAWQLLGLIALRAGDTRAGIAPLQQAVALDNGNAIYHANLGAALHDLGRLHEAVDEYRYAVGLQPDFADMHYRLGNAYAELGALDAAVDAYEQTIAVQPGYAEAHYNLGNAHLRAGHAEQAARAYRRATELLPGFAPGHCNLGNALSRLARYQEAAACYRRALAVDPRFARAWSNLGNVLRELGQHEAALDACNRAIALQPGYARAHSNRGVILKALGRLDAAVRAYRDALAAHPGLTDAHFNLGNILRSQGRLEEAAESYQRVLEIDPRHAFACTQLGITHIQQGRAEMALACCDAFLRRHPGHAGVLACKALALEELGRHQEVRWLVDFDRLIMTRRFGELAGFPSVAAFNAALERHILDHPTLRHDPSTHATRFGRHTGNLLIEPRGPIALYERLIRDAIREYLARHPAEAGHPFLGHPPAGYRLDVWAVVMQAKGHQIPHIHPSAWLSGVYYPRVPALVQEIGAGHAGWIEFGQPSPEWQCTARPQVRVMQPASGTMFLFPSYFWHRTIPYEADELRISIAFDVIAEDR